jgi:predicted dehydrogenase/nucleoside-diphosphate-sugar epimerase
MQRLVSDRRTMPALTNTGVTRLALVGCGFIAEVHLQVLRSLRDVEVVAVCDAVPGRAASMARRHAIARHFDHLDDLLAAGICDAVHVLVPPTLHTTVALPCLQAGLHVLVEKPMAMSAADLDTLEQAAKAKGVLLAVNHNQTTHPALVELERHLQRGRLGRLEHIHLVHNVPLRQLQSGDVGHFMFQTEANILFEQGVHLFSMVHRLLGSCRKVEAIVGEPRTLGNGARFFDEWLLRLCCERGTADVRMAFGRSMLETSLHAVGTDGAATLDLARASCLLRSKSRWLDFLDQGLTLLRGSGHMLRRAVGATAGYVLSLFKLRFPDDPFLRGMRSSLMDFHRAVRGIGSLQNDTEAARAVLDMCLQAARAAGASTKAVSRPAVAEPQAARPGEVLVLGGAGSIGKHCVSRLLAAGRPVTMIVRRPHLLPTEMLDGRVRLFVGDAADPDVLQRACEGADRMLHLATVAGDDVGKVEQVMAEAVTNGARAALQAGVRRLVYASSTAAIYLGGSKPVRGADGTDPRPETRGAYGRAKIAAEAALQDFRSQGLDVVIARPAIVLGGPHTFEHSGVGLWARDNHCVGWGTGRDPLPLVLVDDCADGLVAALDAPAAANKTYNLAGPVRLTARDYMRELVLHTGRDYHYHPTPIWWMWLQEVGKHFVKFLARRPREWPQMRDFRSRSFRAPLDCQDAAEDLGFHPESDRTRFLERLFDEGDQPQSAAAAQVEVGAEAGSAQR